MKLIFSDFKRGEAKIRVTSLDDLWFLSQIIDPMDKVKGETFRKIKIGSGEQQNIIKKPVFLAIEVEKTEFHTAGDMLRVLGIIVEGPDDVPRGTHHTFNVEINSIITITKKEWLDFQINKLKEASSERQPKVLLVVFDREEAHFAYATAYGYEYVSELKGEVAKKADEKKIESSFYEDIVKNIAAYSERYKIERIVVASPAFWKDYLLKQIKDPDLKKKIIPATCSSVDKTAFNEVLKRPEVVSALKESRVVEEINAVEDVMKELMIGKLAKYGIDAVESAANAGAIKLLLVTDEFIRKKRTEKTFERVENTLKLVEQMKGKVMIISSEHEGGKKLDGLGGIAAILRYPLD
jgi:protein pelota